MDVAARDLRDHRSKCLRCAQAVEAITITSHAKPVAKRSPPDAVKAPRPDPLVNVARSRRLAVR